jgi:hypothetical protein
LKLSCTHQLLVNIICGSIHAIKSTVALVVTCRETGLEVNAEKTKFMVRSRDQNAGQNLDIKTDNISLERLEQFKHLGTIITIKIPFMKKIRADRSQGMLVINRCRIFCLAVCYLKL